MSATQVAATTALGRGDLPAASFSFKAWVVIDGKSYATVQVVVTHNKSESRAICELAVGVNTRDFAGLPSIPANFKFTRGLPAQVMITIDDDLGSTTPVNDPRTGYTQLLKKGTHVLFDGVVDDGGPTNLVKGRFNLNVIIVSKLIYLATGSPQFQGLSSNVFGNGIVGLTDDSENPAAMAEDPTTNEDFWKAMQASLTALTELKEENLGKGGNVLDTMDAFLQHFGLTTLSTTNATLLKAIKGSLPGGVFKDTPMGQIVTTFYNAELKYDPVGQTVLQRIKSYADDLCYALIENGYGFAVVPYTPFVATSLIKTTIWPNTVYSASWRSNSTAMIAGLAFIDCVDGAAFSGPPTSPEDDKFSLVGQYTRPGTPIASNPLDPKGKALGSIQCLHAPRWLTGACANPNAVARVKENISDKVNDTLYEFGDPYAREIALKETYQGRALIVECPLRMDIGPCTPVKLVYPDIAGTGLVDAAAIYGSVESVTLALNASSKQAVTTLEIMYVRSEQQQLLDINPGPFGGDGVTKFPYPHPIWAGTYRGQRLDEVPDFQASSSGSSVSTGSGGVSQAEQYGSDAFVNSPGTGSGTGSVTRVSDGIQLITGSPF